MAELMTSCEQLSRDLPTYHRKQKYYLNLNWEKIDYHILRAAVYVLNLIIGDVHVTLEQHDLASRYGFYPQDKFTYRLQYHGVEDIKELKWFLSTAELKQRLYYMEIARRELAEEKETFLAMKQKMGWTVSPARKQKKQKTMTDYFPSSA